MPKPRAGFHNATLQIPDFAWDALCAEAERRDVSVSAIVTELAVRKFKLPTGKIPKPRLPGRRPRK